MINIKILFVNNAPIIKYGIAEGFKKNGCEVSILPLWSYKREEQEVVFRKRIEQFKADIVFAEGHSGLDKEIFFRLIKDLNLNLLYWAIEDPVHINNISMPYAENSKLVLTTAVECVERYKQKGLKADTMLFACNPDFHKSTIEYGEYKHDIVFVGSNYDIRYDAAKKLIVPLVEKDYDIKIWGLAWQDESRDVYIPDKYYGGLLPYEELSKVYSSAKIVLGLHCDDSSRTQSSMRTYEVLGCGAFYLTQYTLAHQKLFQNRKQLVWSNSGEETLDLVDYYLNNTEERNRIARQGQAEVYGKHTYKQRAESVLAILDKIL